MRDSSSTFFAGIPCVENGADVGVGPVHGECAAIGEHHDKRPSGCSQLFDQVFFGFRQIEAGAIATLESGFIHLHLFALQFAGKANDCDHNISLFCRGNSRRVGCGVELCPHQSRDRRGPITLAVVHNEFIASALFQMDNGNLGDSARIIDIPVADQLLAVADQAEQAIRFEAEVVVASLNGPERRLPADGERLGF